MSDEMAFVDIHCHLIPEIDDGAKSWDETLAMAEMAVDDGFTTTIVTPHQLGTYEHNRGDVIRQRTRLLQQELDARGIPLQVMPGADVRIEDAMLAGLRSGDVLTLGDHGQHVLLELPHELYFPLEELLGQLERLGLTGILSHPERNQGLLQQREEVAYLVEAGCLMQVTASSFLGGMGPGPRDMAEWMLAEGLIHFLATDAHGPRSRRPLMRRAFEHVALLSDWDTAYEICCAQPADVAAGRPVAGGRRPRRAKRRTLTDWFTWRKAG